MCRGRNTMPSIRVKTTAGSVAGFHKGSRDRCSARVKHLWWNKIAELGLEQSFPHFRSLTLSEMIKPFKAVFSTQYSGTLRRKDLEKTVRVLWESDADEARLNSIHLLLERTVSQVFSSHREISLSSASKKKGLRDRPAESWNFADQL